MTLRTSPGAPSPLGATRRPHGVNFAVASAHATGCTLVLYLRGAPGPWVELPIPASHRVGDVFAIEVHDLDADAVTYGYRMTGLWAPEEGLLFDPSVVLLDPHARGVTGREVWAEDGGALRGVIPRDAPRREAWTGSPIESLVVYELHARGFTRHPSSGVEAAGMYEGVLEKIPHLTSLGVSAVELLPVFEFDELDNRNRGPSGERLLNYWGYNPVSFFAPKAGYARGEVGAAFRAMVDGLHEAGIEVWLDVVYNHTGEGDLEGPTLSWRGLDNPTYYLLDDDGSPCNYSGTGNTLRCAHPATQAMILESLRWWVTEYGVDGFRFDLAPILGRGDDGEPLEAPPLLDAIARDPVLSKTKLIAEPWDAAGLYQVGSFPGGDRFAEWNGRYRDVMRSFLRGDAGCVGGVADAVAGSPSMYARPGRSINLITSHDGFSLRDLFSYGARRNAANGEDGRDGDRHNLSFNCGAEGEGGPEVEALRQRMMRNALTLLMVSQGVPMLRMGDELGQGFGGNNNPYCHDSPFNWLDWRLEGAASGWLRFVRGVIALRARCPALRSARALTTEGDRPALRWHGVAADRPDWSGHCRTIAWSLDGDILGGADVYVAANMYWGTIDFSPPRPPSGGAWRQVIDTTQASPGDLREPDDSPVLTGALSLGPRSVVVLLGSGDAA